MDHLAACGERYDHGAAVARDSSHGARPGVGKAPQPGVADLEQAALVRSALRAAAPVQDPTWRAAGSPRQHPRASGARHGRPAPSVCLPGVPGDTGADPAGCVPTARRAILEPAAHPPDHHRFRPAYRHRPDLCDPRGSRAGTEGTDRLRGGGAGRGRPSARHLSPELPRCGPPDGRYRDQPIDLGSVWSPAWHAPARRRQRLMPPSKPRRPSMSGHELLHQYQPWPCGTGHIGCCRRWRRGQLRPLGCR
jgi:hypothetical protein